MDNMKPSRSIFLFLAMFCMLSVQAKDKKQFKGYTKEANGSYSKMLVKGSGTTGADTGGAFFVKVKFLTESDSVFMDINNQTHQPSLMMACLPPKFAGDFMDLFSRLHPGDSARFYVRHDLLKKNYPGEFDFANKKLDSMEYVGFAVKMDSVWSRAKIIEQRRKQDEKKRLERETYNKIMFVMGPIHKEANARVPWLKAHEDSLFADYKKTSLSALTPDNDGVYYIELLPGTGELIDTGMTIGCRYTGTYLDGTIFDANTLVAGQDPLFFKIGQPGLIPGFARALAKMRMGGRMRVIIPPAMGYRDGLTRIFEIEIVSVAK
jgi:FKBP-type peptidyl-prolyl cis-trans isomerase